METSGISCGVRVFFFFFLARRAKRGGKKPFREVFAGVGELSVFPKASLDLVACTSCGAGQQVVVVFGGAGCTAGHSFWCRLQ